MRQWHTETRSIADLKPYHKNPRKLSDKQFKEISASIEKFGLTDKPLVQPDGTIIGGHQRIKVLKKLKYKEIPVLVPDVALDERELEEAVIRHNKNTGEWDFDILSDLTQWDMMSLIDWGFEKGDFPEVEIVEPEGEEDEKETIKCKLCPHCGKEI